MPWAGQPFSGFVFQNVIRFSKNKSAITWFHFWERLPNMIFPCWGRVAWAAKRMEERMPNTITTAVLIFWYASGWSRTQVQLGPAVAVVCHKSVAMEHSCQSRYVGFTNPLVQKHESSCWRAWLIFSDIFWICDFSGWSSFGLLSVLEIVWELPCVVTYCLFS